MRESVGGSFRASVFGSVMSGAKHVYVYAWMSCEQACVCILFHAHVCVHAHMIVLVHVLGCGLVIPSVWTDAFLG